ncbi:MAG: hypothetical protein J6K80_00600 [Oscillospiraceae bacterium]|nr:hypothetical protein [Oscillospiraceae bacterium]
MKKLFVIFSAVMLLLCGCSESVEQQSISPYTVIDSVLGSRTVGDGCVYERIRHTDGSQAIAVMDINSDTKKLLNEETELGNVGDSYGNIFYADGYLYRLLNIGDYQKIEQFTADGKFVKESIINNDTEYWIDHYRTSVISDGEKLYFDGKVYHDRWDGNDAVLSLDPNTMTMEAVYEFTEGGFDICGVYEDCFILNSTVPNPHPEVDKEYIPVVELLNMKTFEREILFENTYEGEYAGNKWFQLDSERIYTSFSFNDMPVYNLRTRERSTLPIHSEGDGYYYVFSITEPADDRTMVWTSDKDYTKHSYYMYNLKIDKKTAVYESIVSGERYPSMLEYVDGYYLVKMGTETFTAQSGKEVTKELCAWIKAKDLYDGKANFEYIKNTVEYR